MRLSSSVLTGSEGFAANRARHLEMLAVAEEAAGRGWGEGDGGEGPPTATVTLALPRRPALAELRRHKRDFLRALSGPLAALPANGPAAVRAFVAHLGRAVRDR